MNTTKIVVRLVMAWIAMMAAQMAVGMVIHPKTPPNPNPLLFLMVYDAFIVVAMGAAALRSDWRDWRLVRALFLVPAAIGVANWIEGAWYLPNVGIDWRAYAHPRHGLAGRGFPALVRSSSAARRCPSRLSARPCPIAPSFKDCGASRSAPHATCSCTSWRERSSFPLCATTTPRSTFPAAGQIVAMQFFVRGPVFILVCLTLLRMFRLPHWSGAVAVGLAFTFISGVAALIMPNGIFPDTVRWAHFCEVTSSNFVFGFVVGWIWGHAQRVTHLAHATA